ncbi:MAG: ABC transporter substrate-binding protein [Alphaproteobacteria bacterium]
MDVRRIASRFRTTAAVFAVGAATAAMTLPPAGFAAAQDKPIKVGITTELTGVAAAWARSQVNGVQLAIDQINASGGLLGRKLELLVRDSQLKPDLGASLTRDLILRESVDVLIGPIASADGMTVSAMAKQYKKVVMMAGPNSPRLTMENFHPYIFQISPTGLMEARAMAEAIGPKYNRIAFIGADSEASHQGLKYFKEWLAKVNPAAQIVGEAWPKFGEPDYSSYITSLISSKPDAIFSYLFGADLIGFIKQANPYGVFEKTKFAGYLQFDDLKALGPDLPDGMIGQMRSPFFATACAYCSAMERGRTAKFVEQYQAKYNDYPSIWAEKGYEALLILAQAIEKAGTLDSDAIVRATEQIRYQGLHGTITFRSMDHQGNVGSYFGTTATNDKYPFKVLTNEVRIPAEKIWPSQAEVDQARAAK